MLLSIFGDIEELVGDLYPYRWPITIGLVLVSLAILAFAYRQGWHLIAWRHKLPSAVIAIVFVAVSVPAGDYLLSPLFERSTVCEASPIAGAGAGSEGCQTDSVGAAMASTATPSPVTTRASQATATPTPAATSTFAARVTHQGQFHGADDFHYGEGTALIIETAPDQYVLRFEEFSVRNGPDLFVYLSPQAGDVGGGAINLGGLKGTDGAFNYDIPAGTDVSQFQSAIVWCKQFSVLFAAAPLSEA